MDKQTTLTQQEHDWTWISVNRGLYPATKISGQWYIRPSWAFADEAQARRQFPQENALLETGQYNIYVYLPVTPDAPAPI